MKDFFESAWHQLRDRMTSPIFGSFIIAWFFWNHQYFVIIFSDLPVEYRFKLAHELLYPTTTDLVRRAFEYPLISCVAYIVLYPLASRNLLRYWDWQQTEIENLRKVAQNKRLLSYEESNAIIAENVDIRLKLNEAAAKHAREIEALTDTPESNLASRLKQTTERIEAIEKELSPVPVESAPPPPNESDELASLSKSMKHGVRSLLSALAVLPNQVGSITDVSPNMRVSQVKVRAFLDKALNVGMVKLTDDRTRMYLTPKGREYVVNEDLESEEFSA